MKNQKSLQPMLSWDQPKKPAKIASRIAPPEKRRCNLCGGRYRAPNSFSRFCRTCRTESETYRIAEWTPTVELSI